MERLRISEIFLSLQGESLSVGLPTVFIRLTGCPLRCRYCDTAYAFHGGVWMELSAVMEQVSLDRVRHVTVTGGEPLAQKACHALLKHLCDADYAVSLETSGAMDVSGVDTRVIKVLDLKTPASGEETKNLWMNLDYLSSQDQIKIVICDRADYEWAKRMMVERSIAAHCEVLFSPSHGQLAARELADWIVQDRLAVRFQVQLHKYLWGDERGR